VKSGGTIHNGKRTPPLTLPLLARGISPLLEDEKPSTFAVSTRAVAKNLI
jgi:hypothetical protein